MSKWILIDTDDSGDILEPKTFDTYEEAHAFMVDDVNALKEDNDDVSIHGDYASVQTEEDMLQRNCVCDFTFVQKGRETYRENIYTLDAYMMAYDMAANGDVECYMAPNGAKAYRPVFAVIDGAITLSGTMIV